MEVGRLMAVWLIVWLGAGELIIESLIQREYVIASVTLTKLFIFDGSMFLFAVVLVLDGA